MVGGSGSCYVEPVRQIRLWKLNDHFVQTRLPVELIPWGPLPYLVAVHSTPGRHIL